MGLFSSNSDPSKRYLAVRQTYIDTMRDIPIYRQPLKSETIIRLFKLLSQREEVARIARQEEDVVDEIVRINSQLNELLNLHL